MMVACRARVEQWHEDSLEEDLDDVLEVLAEVCEKAEEDGDHEAENLTLIRHTVT